MFCAGDRIGVAVSGGADSVALLRLLADLRPVLGINLAVLHFNHLLRGAESDADEQFVASLAADLNLELLAARDDVAAAALARGWNLEDAGRRLRYGFFSSLLNAGQVTRVAVAHTADDQAETVLARLLRGTGPAGLASIYPVKGRIVRPLLGIRRQELRAALVQRGQSWREDPSNQDATRLRAKLRHDVLPLLERGVQPGIVSHLGRLAQLAREDEAFWTAVTSERLRALARWEDADPGSPHHTASHAAPYDQHDPSQTVATACPRCGIRCADLLAALPWLDSGCSDEARFAVTRRLVRGMIEKVQGHCQELTAQHVEQVVQLATRSSSGRRTQLPGVVVERSFDWLWFAKSAQSLPPSLPPSSLAASAHVLEPQVLPGVPQVGSGTPPLALPSACHTTPATDGKVSRDAKSCNANSFSHVISLGAVGDSTIVVITEIGRRFRLKVIDWPDVSGETINVLDRDLLRPPLVLRSWQPGDSFRPQGRRSVHKLKYFLRTSRIDARDRVGWPVLTSAGDLVWARGLPVAAQVVPGSATRAGVVILEEEM